LIWNAWSLPDWRKDVNGSIDSEHSRTRALRKLTSDDVVAVRPYFEDLGQRPNARFLPPQ